MNRLPLFRKSGAIVSNSLPAVPYGSTLIDRVFMPLKQNKQGFPSGSFLIFLIFF